jgi:hypothetical protein
MDFLPFNGADFPGWQHERGVASSNHLLPGDWNPVHPYQAATRETEIANLLMGIGRFQNSEDEESLYAALKAQGGPFWAEGGLATGYSGAPVVPFGRVGVDITDGISAFAAPAYNVDEQQLGAVLGLNFDLLEW